VDELFTRGVYRIGVSMGGFLPPSLCRTYEAKFLQMKKESSSENSPRFIFGFSKFAL